MRCCVSTKADPADYWVRRPIVMKNTISVVIPTVGEETLPRTVEAVLRQTRPADEIIVVGRDQSGRMARFPGVRFIDTGRPASAAEARNRGIAATRGDIVALTDSDCVPLPDWLARHEEAHTTGQSVVGGGVELSGTNYWAQADNVAMFHDFVPRRPAGYRTLLPTLNLSIRRSVIEEVGGLDETLPSAEDAEWTIRICRAGWPIYFEPAARVRHAPMRTRPSDVVRHWRKLGYSSIRVRLRYRQEFRTPRWAGSAFWVLVLSPLIAARVTAGIYRQRWAWRAWKYLPVVYASKIWFCQGAAESIRSGYAFDRSQNIPHIAPRRDKLAHADPAMAVSARVTRP